MTWPLEPDGARALRRRACRTSWSSRRSRRRRGPAGAHALQPARGSRPVGGRQARRDRRAAAAERRRAVAAATSRSAIAARLAQHGLANAGAAPRRLARLEAASGPLSRARRPPVAAHAVLLLGLPAQHLDQRARRQPRDGRHRLPRHGDVACPRGAPRTFTQMGGEGAAWIGQAPFTADKHVFQNLGDGTYFHSGLLAIRAAAAAGVNITYKILFNDAVAMTGGQPADGQLTVPQIARQVAAEGAKRVVVVTDEPEKYAAVTRLAARRHRPSPRRARRGAARAARGPGPHRADLRPDLRGREAPPAQARRLPGPRRARVHQRRGLRGLRRLLGEVELRRRSSRWTPSSAASARSTSRSCNKDFSCVEGLLPELRHRAGRQRPPRPGARGTAQGGAMPALAGARAVRGARRSPTASWSPASAAPACITVGALLGMAAHLEGKGCTRARLHRPRAEERRGHQPRPARAEPGATCTPCASPPAAPTSCWAATWWWPPARRSLCDASTRGSTRAVINGTLQPTSRIRHRPRPGPVRGRR